MTYPEDPDEEASPFPPDDPRAGWNDENGDGVPDGPSTEITPDIFNDPDARADFFSALEGVSGEAAGLISEGIQQWLVAHQGSDVMDADADGNGVISIGEFIQEAADWIDNSIDSLVSIYGDVPSGGNEKIVQDLLDLRAIADAMEAMKDPSWAPTPGHVNRDSHVHGSAGWDNAPGPNNAAMMIQSDNSSTSIPLALLNRSLFSANSLNGRYDIHPDGTTGVSTSASFYTYPSVTYHYAVQNRQRPNDSVDASSSDPVRTANGEYFYRKTDLEVEGVGGLDLKIERVYQSRHLKAGIFGPNWSSPLLETHMLVWPTQNERFALDVSWGDGSRSLHKQNDATFQNDIRWNGIHGSFNQIRLYPDAYLDDTFEAQVPNPTANAAIMRGFVLRRPDGMRFFFCPPTITPGGSDALVCHLRKVSDLYGNAITIKRDNVGQPYEVTDTKGRTLELEYGDDFKVSRISDWTGREWQYSYDPDTGDLVRVDQPSDIVLDSNLQLGLDRPYESYTYDVTVDAVGDRQHNRFLDHNLTSVSRSGEDALVEVVYNQQAGPDFDRVASLRIDGGVTSYTYDMVGQLPDVTHTVTVDFPEGEREIFHHSGGKVASHEIVNGRFEPNGQLIASSVEPGSPSSWVSLFEYAENGLLSSSTVNAAPDGSGGRRTDYTYDADSPFIFRRGNVLSVVQLPDSEHASAQSELTWTYGYDPITNGVLWSVDERGQRRDFTFDHQELDYEDAKTDITDVAVWDLLPDTPEHSRWNLQDVNGDGVIGRTYEVIMIESPAADVANSGDPSGLAVAAHRETTLLSYDRRGRLRASTDGAGTRTEFRYVRYDMRSLVEDAGGENLTTTYWYDDLGRVSSQLSPSGIRTDYSYSHFNQVTTEVVLPSVAEPAYGAAIRRERYFDLGGRLVGVGAPTYGSTSTGYADASPDIVQILAYDSVDRLVSTTTRLLGTQGEVLASSINQVKYNGQGRVENVERSDGVAVEHVYSSRGKRTKTTTTDPFDGAVAVHGWNYNQQGDPIERILPRRNTGSAGGPSSTIEVDGYGRTVQITGVDGLVTKFSLDAGGLIEGTEVLTQGGDILRSSTSEFDGLGRLQRQTIDGSEFDWGGNSSAKPSLQQVRRLGYGYRASDTRWAHLRNGVDSFFTHLTTDDLGRPTGSFYGTGLSVGSETTYQVGRVATTLTRFDEAARSGPISPSEVVTALDYDGFGRVKLHIVGGANPSSSVFNARGQVTTATFADGSEVEVHYDGLGRRTKLTRHGSAGGELSQNFEYQGTRFTPSSIVDEAGVSTTYTHDGFGQLRSRETADGATEFYSYDAWGNLVLRVGFDGGTTTLVWNDRGQLESLHAVGGSANVDQTFEYDALGSVRRATDVVNGASVLVERALNSNGDLVKERVNYEGRWSREFGFSYDGLGRLRSTTYPSSRQVTRTYDSRSRLESVSADGVLLVSYDSFYGALPRAADLDGGLRHESELDVLGQRVSTKLLSTSSSNVLWGESLTYVQSSLLDTRTDLASGRVDKFDYDEHQRLKKWMADVGPLAQTPVRTIDYSWDGRGNLDLRQDSQWGGADLTIASSGRLTSSLPAIASFEYDPNGRETGRTESTGGREEWQWDALGRPMRSIRRVGGNVTRNVLYRHDAFGRFVQQEDVLTGVTERRAYHGEDLALVERDGATPWDYVSGSQAGASLARLSAGGKQLLHVDHRGDVVAVTQAGALVESVEYDPFGVPRSGLMGPALDRASTSLDEMHLGRPFAFGFEKTLMGQRVFDHQHARFLSKDPLREVDGPNLYSYAGQDPYRWIDRNGTEGTKVRVLPLPGSHLGPPIFNPDSWASDLPFPPPPTSGPQLSGFGDPGGIPVGGYSCIACHPSERERGQGRYQRWKETPNGGATFWDIVDPDDNVDVDDVVAALELTPYLGPVVEAGSKINAGDAIVPAVLIGLSWLALDVFTAGTGSQAGKALKAADNVVDSARAGSKAGMALVPGGKGGGKPGRLPQFGRGAAKGGARVTGDALKAARGEFSKVRPKFWKNEAATNPGKYGADDLTRMGQGKPPIGSDGFPMELHHGTPLSQGGSNAFGNLNPMTRTDHRLGSNFGQNHPK